MARAAASQVLAIMGSGETSPTMVTVHKALVAGLGGQPAGALLLQTPYAFQENCADISARARQYFARSVGLTVSVFPDDEPACQGPGPGAGPAGPPPPAWPRSAPPAGCSAARAARRTRWPGGTPAASARLCGTGSRPVTASP